MSAESRGFARTGEDRIVRILRRQFGRHDSALKLGIGDDAAVLRPAGSDELWAVTTDLLIEEIDFRPGWSSPRQLGHKSLAVNLSDLAAMGARPRYYLAGLGLPPGTRQSWINSFYRGMSILGSRYGALLIGGDLSKSGHGLFIAITALGESRHRRLVYRSGGKAGDHLFVTGSLGVAASGLKLLQMGRMRGENPAERKALKAQREPEPRCDAGLWLAQSSLASCMMDLSDGISADLPRLCEASGTGAEIYTDNLPLYSEARAWGCDPMALALHGGEDFELLFAVPESRLKAFRKALPLCPAKVAEIGKLIREKGVVCRSVPGAPARRLPRLAFDHFRS